MRAVASLVREDRVWFAIKRNQVKTAFEEAWLNVPATFLHR